MSVSDLLSAAAPDDVLVSLFSDAEVRADPYRAYRRLREAAPVHRSEVLPMWVVTRFDDCASVLRDPRFGKSDEAQRIFGSAPDASERDVPIISRHSMLRMNPPDHTRLRGLVAREFTPKRVEALRPAIAAMVDAILDRLADAGGGDVMDVLAFPLPVKVIGELLGVPEADRDQFRWIVRDAAAALELSLLLQAAASTGASSQAAKKRRGMKCIMCVSPGSTANRASRRRAGLRP